MKRLVKAGDWVSFMRNAQIVYGKVEYVHERKSWQRSDAIVTTAGEVESDSVLEVRSEKGSEA